MLKRKLKKALLKSTFVLSLLAIDWVSKRYLVECCKREIFRIGSLSLYTHYTVNAGSLWGFLAEYQELLFFLRVLAITTILLYGLVNGFSFSLLMIAAGAIGNFVSFCLDGYVVDILEIRYKSFSSGIFNLADVFVLLGVILLFLGL